MKRFDWKTTLWIRSAGAQVVACGKNTHFAVPQKFLTEELVWLLKNFDSVLAGGKILKDSPTTTAALADAFFEADKQQKLEVYPALSVPVSTAFPFCAGGRKIFATGNPDAAGHCRRGMSLRLDPEVWLSDYWN